MDETSEGIWLDLDHEEAQFLADVLSRVGGNMFDSRRKHAEAISQALAAVGVEYQENDGAVGSIQFQSETEPTLPCGCY